MRELDARPENVIFNQFCEFGNYLGPLSTCTGPRARARLRARARRAIPALRLAAFVSATGSAGTIAAGDWLKERLRRPHRRRRGARMPDPARQRLRRAQHPGHRRQARPAHPQRDEHRLRGRRLRPRHRRALTSLFNTDAGRDYLGRRKRRRPTLDALGSFGFSGSATCSRHQARQAPRPRPGRRRDHGRDRRRGDVRQRAGQGRSARRSRDGFDEVAAGETFGQHLAPYRRRT